MNRIEVKQGENVTVFEFNELADLLQFAEICLECGAGETVVTIYEGGRR